MNTNTDKAARIFDVIQETATHISQEDALFLADKLATMDLAEFNALWERRKWDFPDHMDIIEARVIAKLLDTILANDSLYVRVHDGEEFATAPTRDRAMIEKETCATQPTP